MRHGGILNNEFLLQRVTGTPSRTPQRNFEERSNIPTGATNSIPVVLLDHWESGMQHYQPNEQRHCGQPTDVARAAQSPSRRRFNWWGLWGLLISLGSFLTAGFASPLALLICANGLRRAKGPRGAALAGTVFSLIGIMLAGSIVALAIHQERAYRETRFEQQREAKIAELVQETNVALKAAQRELSQFEATRGHLPDGIAGNILMLKHTDGWGKEIRYDAATHPLALRSAGADQHYNTADDVVVKLEATRPSDVAIKFAPL